MTKLTSLARVVACAVVLLAGGMTALPAFAAAADFEFLETFLGNWKGRGVLTGSSSETVVCKLSLTPANDTKINYSGRCSLAGTTLAIAGTVAYIEASRRFEAAMTSNASFGGTAVGRKQGNSIVFNIDDVQKDDDGKDMKVRASMILQNDKISVTFEVVFVETGDTLNAKVPFTKS